MAGSIREDLPPAPYVVVCVEERWDGLSFYLDGSVERVTTRENPYPFFVPPKPLDEKFVEMQDSRYSYALICHNNAATLATVRAGFDKLHVHVEERVLPFDRHLFFSAKLNAPTRH